MAEKNTKKVIHKIRKRLSEMEQLLRSLDDPSPGEARSLIGRIAVEGRSITNILQHLRGVEPDFENWYAPYRAEMVEDDLCKFFYVLRTDTLKHGEDHVKEGILTLTHQKNTTDFLSITAERVTWRVALPDGSVRTEFRPAPPNAVSAFLNDETGGAGWVIRNDDGTESKVYFRIPPSLAQVQFYFQDPPQVHLGKNVTGLSANELCQAYVDYIRGMVKDAESKFRPAN